MPCGCSPDNGAAPAPARVATLRAVDEGRLPWPTATPREPYAAGVAVLIDPPSWPAHGTTFSHLVSDASLDELHAFAAGAGIREAAFDRDHYDVPAGRYEDLVALGAQPVGGGELIRRLRASGLRVPVRDRPEKVAAVLRRRWPARLGSAAAVRDELVERWSQPHRHYHGPGHLLAVLEALDRLCAPSSPSAVLQLAAWFHDAVYDGVPGRDEEDSAALAEQALGGILTDHDASEVARLVRLTAEHRTGVADVDGSLLIDADLSILGASPEQYRRYVTQVRRDYAHVDDHAWRTGRARVLERLLALDPLYRTERGRALWQAAALANMRNELAELTR